ncbi:MAG TPA: carboxypeptidase-like regulatory domain-containing protein, partial [bacterium]|nr:carboxypeptidase-like regulatory domain-containing protein [bacterium]
SKSTYTDTSGHYEIEQIPTGTCDLVISKDGYDDLEKKVEISEGNTCQISYSIDNKILGRVLIEDGTDYSGSTVTISQGDFNEVVEVDERGIYIFPDPGSFNDGTVTIQVSNSCDYYSPFSATAQVSSGQIVNSIIPTMILPLNLTPPENFEVYEWETSLYIKWDAKCYSDDFGYRILRSTEPDGNYKMVLEGNTTKCFDNRCGLHGWLFDNEPDTKYYFKAQTFSTKTVAESPFTEVDSATYITKSEDIVLSINFEEDDIYASETIYYDFILANTGTISQLVCKASSGLGTRTEILTDTEGEKWYSDSHKYAMDGETINIAPGSQYVESFLLSSGTKWSKCPYCRIGQDYNIDENDPERLLEFTKTGRYRYQALYYCWAENSTPDRWYGYLSSNEVEFEITGGDSTQ